MTWMVRWWVWWWVVDLHGTSMLLYFHLKARLEGKPCTIHPAGPAIEQDQVSCFHALLFFSGPSLMLQLRCDCLFGVKVSLVRRNLRRSYVCTSRVWVCLVHCPDLSRLTTTVHKVPAQARIPLESATLTQVAHLVYHLFAERQSCGVNL